VVAVVGVGLVVDGRREVLVGGTVVEGPELRFEVMVVDERFATCEEALEQAEASSPTSVRRTGSATRAHLSRLWLRVLSALWGVSS
jgi:hypothetical protein